MKSVTKSPYQVIRRPRITEKAAIEQSLKNCVVFEVHPRANKTEIKNAVETIFDVKVDAVRTLNYLGKKTGGLRHRGGQKRDWKKAYVTLSEGSSLEMIEGL